MHTTDLSVEVTTHEDDDLSPDARRREVAAILAVGLLRLQSRPNMLLPDDSVPPEKYPNNSQKALESLPPVRTHVGVG